jgi:hypothetical protein
MHAKIMAAGETASSRRGVLASAILMKVFPVNMNASSNLGCIVAHVGLGSLDRILPIFCNCWQDPFVDQGRA